MPDTIDKHLRQINIEVMLSIEISPRSGWRSVDKAAENRAGNLPASDSAFDPTNSLLYGSSENY